METKYYVTDKGVKMAYYHHDTYDSKVGIVIIHGLAEHKGRYKEFAMYLVKNSISVFAVDIRGHGESSGKRGDIGCFEDYVEDINSFICYIRETYPQLRLALFGHSLGGLVAVVFAETKQLIDFLILSSPSLQLMHKVKILSLIPAKVLENIKIKKLWSESKEMLEYSQNDPYACHSVTLRLLKVSFINGIKYAISNLNTITVPLLMLGGQYDNFVNSGKLGVLLNEFGSSDKTIIIYENAKHRIVQNAAKDKAFSDIVQWIEKRI